MAKVEKTYSSTVKTRSPKELADEVRKALAANEKQARFDYEPEERRRVLREELAHHLPVSHRPVKVTGLVGTDEEGEYDKATVAIKHYETTPGEELASSTAPLQDRRFQQELSCEDEKIAKKAKKRLFGIID